MMSFMDRFYVCMDVGVCVGLFTNFCLYLNQIFKNGAQIQRIKNIKRISTEKDLLRAYKGQQVILQNMIPLPLSEQDILFTCKKYIMPGMKSILKCEPIVGGPHYNQLRFQGTQGHVSVVVGYEDSIASPAIMKKSQFTGHYAFKKLTPIFVLGTVGIQLDYTRVQFLASIMGVNANVLIQQYVKNKKNAEDAILFLMVAGAGYVLLRVLIERNKIIKRLKNLKSLIKK